MRTRIQHTPKLLLALLVGALSCSDIPTAIRPLVPEPPPPARRVLGVVTLRVSVVGPGAVQGSASVAKPGTLGSSGARFALSDASPDGDRIGPIFKALDGGGSFTKGLPGAGYRYVFIAFKVGNAGVHQVDGDTLGFTTPRQNLHFIALEIPEGHDGIAGTPFSDLQKFNGDAADPAIAAGIIPTGAVRQTLTGDITTHSPDVLQVFSEEEVAPGIFTSFNTFPYGYVISHLTETTTRTLAANPVGPDWYDGIITLGLKIPLQANPADDVYGFGMSFALVEDSQTRITQSLEEQDAAGQTAFEARVAALNVGGLSGVTLLPGGSYGGSVSVPVRTLCRVRISGTVAAPVAFLGTASGTCPTLSSVSPSSGAQGDTVSVTLTGTNFVDGETTVAVSGSDVTVGSVVVNSPTELTANFEIGASAATGARNVTVTTPVGTSVPQTFTVAGPPPTITSISPNSGPRGAPVDVTIIGTNFVTGETSVEVSGEGAGAGDVVVVSSTELTAKVGLDPAEDAGPRSVTVVTTAGGTSNAVTFTFTP